MLKKETEALCEKCTVSLRVGSYNIRNGSDVGHDMTVLAAVIEEMGLDVVGLQEVDICTSRAKGKNTLKLLAEAAGYEYYRFTKATDFEGGEYGTAIMSRYPIESFESFPLTTDAGMEKRAVGHAVLNVNGVLIDYFNTHMSYGRESVIKKQFRQLEEISKNASRCIITADFNTQNLAILSSMEGRKLVNGGQYPTFTRDNRAIDDIILDGRWRINASGMVVSDGRSDHNMIWADITYTDWCL